MQVEGGSCEVDNLFVKHGKGDDHIPLRLTASFPARASVPFSKRRTLPYSRKAIQRDALISHLVPVARRDRTALRL